VESTLLLGHLCERGERRIEDLPKGVSVNIIMVESDFRSWPPHAVVDVDETKSLTRLVNVSGNVEDPCE